MYEDMRDQVNAMLHSDVWRLVKYRIMVEYRENLRKRLEATARAGGNVGPIIGAIDVLPDIVDITERIPADIDKDKLNVDEALLVIENIRRNGR